MEGRFEGLNYLPVSIAVLDGNGRITFVNRAWTEFSLANGYDGGDFVGGDYASLCSCVEGAERAQASAFGHGVRMVLERKERRFEMVYPCHAPRIERWFKGIVSAMKSETVVTHVDITAEYRQVSDRESLVERSKRAHDIQSLLTAVIGYSEMGQGLPNSQHNATLSADYFGTIEKAARRLSEDLVFGGVKTAESGGQSAVAVSLRRLLAEIRDELMPRAERAAVRVDLDVDEVFHLWAREEELWRVFHNLLSNAVKYNRAQGSVLISAKYDRAGGIEVSFRDTGIGMETATIDAVFVPYRRLDSDAAVKLREGTGLGLAIVAETVERTGGDIDVVSEPGGGSEFKVRFPSWRTCRAASSRSQISQPETRSATDAETGRRDPARCPAEQRYTRSRCRHCPDLGLRPSR